ncbi:SusC/RagA family TonB-linked outer membrane protein [Roseimarinus sediminis]|uniref:SusC/RagA family TonB-linked outer membrane protein n=1 Tax=Roseimarinus sediminis TaxID=1610899 RepID=UPI003D1DE9B9
MKYIKTILVALIIAITGAYANAQNNQESVNTVTGVVYNASTKNPIEAAAVSIGRVSSGFTDAEGRFSIEVRSENDVITIKAEGFHTQNVPVKGRSEVNVYLQLVSMYSLQELSYSAFDSKQKIYTAQSVASINPQHQTSATKMNAGSGEAAFDGRIPGLDVRSRNGIKGIGSNLFLRGYSSLYLNNQPLIVVDGMIYDTENHGNSLIDGYYANPLGGINVNDIENVTVVRDAASIYGAKAANGVIFIRTSHTQKQATSIELSVNGNMEIAPDNIPLLGSEDYRTYLNEIMVQQYGLNAVSKMEFLNTNTTSPNYYSYHNNSNWQDKVFQDNYSTNYNLKIKGGDDVALYALSVSFLQQNGTVKESGNSRFNFRFNSDIKFSNTVTLNSNIGFNYMTKDITGSGIENYYDPVYISRIKAPFLLEFEQDEEGTASPVLSDYDFLNVSNPVALVNNMTQEDITYRLFGSFNFNWQISDKIVASNLIGLTFDKDRQRIFIPRQGVVPDSVDYGEVTNQMKTRVLRNFVINNDLRVKYSNDFGTDHQLDVLAGARLKINDLEEDWAADYNSANDQMRSLGNGNFLLRQKGGFIGQWSSLTWYLSADYAFKNKYLLTLNVGLDGSSRFGDQAGGLYLFETPFMLYPSLAAAWLVSSESFMADTDAVDVLKIRASYGLTGNDNIGNYTARKYYSSETFLGYQGSVLGALYNPALGPEKTAKLNLGVDMALFRERLTITADVFSNKTSKLFDYIPVNDYSGFDGYYGNYGGLTTSGFDFSVNSRLVNTKAFKWDLGLVYSKFTTTIDELYNDKRTANFYTANILTEVGQPISQFYGYKTKGVYATDALADEAGLVNRMDNEDLVPFGAGDVIFEDLVADGIIDENDMQVLGNPTPDFMGEVFTKLKYKNITLDAALSFSYGAEVFNYLRYSLENMSTTNNQTQVVLNRWRYQGQQTDIPRAAFGDPMGNARFSDRWIEDGSYARLKNLTLSYMINLNSNLLKYAEVYATGVNLLTFTNYKGLDPEFSIDGAALMQGIDLGMVPQNKMVLLGVKIGL